MAHRYWRASLIDGYGGAGLELTAFWLLAGPDRVDAPAVLIASRAPDVGNLAILQGLGPVSGNIARWNDCAGLSLTWDFGPSDANWPAVTDIRLGSGSCLETFARAIVLEGRDDGASWTPWWSFQDIAWPGAWQLSASVQTPVAVRQVTAPVITGNASGIEITAPSLAYGSLLVALLLARQELAALPEGWSLLSQSDWATGTEGTRQRTMMLARQCSPGDGGALFSFAVQSASSLLGVQLLELSAAGSAIVLEQALAASYSNLAANAAKAIPLPVLTSARDGCLALGCIGNILATSSGDTAYAASAPWVMRTAAAAQLRLACASVSLEAGQTTAGTLTPSYGTVSSIWGATAHALIFGALPGIARSPVIWRTHVSEPARVHSSGGLPTAMSARGLPGVARGQLDYRLNNMHSLAAASQTGHVAGYVQHKDVPANTPVHRRVRLYRSRDGLLVQEQWSDPVTGAYDFRWVEIDQTYTVMADDYTGNWRAVIADRIPPQALS